jgi:hypothetical protein
MAWKLQGSYFESCTCDVVCPCTASFSLGATQDYCRVTLVFHVEQGENLGVVQAPIEYRGDGLHHSVKIGDEIELAVEDVVPFGAQDGQPVKLVGVFHPAGRELTVARTTRSKVDAFGIEYEGNSAFSTQCSWAA